MKKPIYLFLFVFSFANLALAADFIPKYGPENSPKATLLSKDHAYIQSKGAPDFWSLIPYYQGMQSSHSASVASVGIVLNALQQDKKYSSSDELVTEKTLLKKIAAKKWAFKLLGKKPVGVNLTELGLIVQDALAKYKITNHTVKVINVVYDSSDTTTKIRKLLIENEASNNNFLIANYLQSAFTNDPEGAVGTYSAVGAFDEEKDRVLILETDRKYYEPYWVSLQTFVEGLTGLKDPKTNLSIGGLIWVN